MNALVDPRITKARSRLIIDHPFFGCLAMNLIVRPSNNFDTMATDAKHLFYRPSWLDEPSATADDVMFKVAHQVLHCALGHCSRRGNREHKRWNIACDHVVNLMLVDSGMWCPPDMFCDRRFTGLSAEKVYDILEQEEKKPEPPPPPEQQPQDPEEGGAGDDDDSGDDDEGDEDGDGDDEFDDGESGGDGDPDDAAGDEPGTDPGQPGDQCDAPGDDADGEGQGAAGGDDDGSGKPGDVEGGAGDDPVSHGDPGRCGEVLDAAPPHDQAALDESVQEWEVATRQAVNIARRQGEGKLPGFIEEVIEHLDDPRTDWRDALRRFVDPFSATKDYSWSSPSRRMMAQGFYVPGFISDGVHHVALVIDTSGSVNERLLAAFGGEAQAALDAGAIDKVTVIMADVAVRSFAEYSIGDQIDFTVVGRGGTRFDTSFAWLNENAPDVACAIYFTDLDCTDFGPEPAYPVLWAGYDPDPQRLKYLLDRVPFGEAVEVTAF